MIAAAPAPVLYFAQDARARLTARHASLGYLP